MSNAGNAQYKHLVTVLGADAHRRFRFLQALIDGKCERHYLMPSPGEDFFLHHVMVDDEDILLFFYWFWPSETYAEITLQYMRIHERILVVLVSYDHSDPDNFKRARDHLHDIRNRSKCPDVPTFLVDCEFRLDRERCVSEEEGRALADEFSCLFSKISVFTGDGISELLVEIAIQARERRAVLDKRQAERKGQQDLAKEKCAKSEKSCAIQ